MLQSTRQGQVERMMHAGLKNLYANQNQFSFDEFAVITLEGLMLLEREEYLKSRGNDNTSGLLQTFFCDNYFLCHTMAG